MLSLITMLLAGATTATLFASAPADISAVNASIATEVQKTVTQSVMKSVQEYQSVETKQNANGRYVTVTAYTSEARQTDSTPCISSDGSNICNRYAKGELICAAGDRNVPLGSKFHVEGYGVCSVADRMNIRYNGTGRVDIYLGYDTPAAFRWGAGKHLVTRM
jgi:3D (Asp-Asp-Asp) domain-containing protein